MGELAVFSRTTQKSMEIVKRVQEETNIDDPHKAFQAMKVALQTLRDRIPVEEAVNLGAQLPNLVAGFYYDGWKPAATPTKERTLQDFLDNIREYLSQVDPQLDAEHTVRGVFKVLTNIVSEGEIEDILKTLPREIRELWPQTAEEKVNK